MFIPRARIVHGTSSILELVLFLFGCLAVVILGGDVDVDVDVVPGASLSSSSTSKNYDPTWDSLDRRPLPEWYPNAKIGIFIHWGVFSVPGFKNEWFWNRWHEKNGRGHEEYSAFVNATETFRFNYPDYAHRFDATLYQPDDWADIFAQSGAQYVVLTSKHHEGYCMFDSRNITTTWNWNVMDIGPRRDLLGDLANAIRKPNVVSAQTNVPLKFGLYHSLYEWFNPMFVHDQQSNFSTQIFVDTKTMPELYHLVETYKPEVIWSDGDWGAPSDYWKSKDFLAWLATNSSVKNTVVWNDRWGDDAKCKHGSFNTCHDRYLPNVTQDHVFENAFTLDKGSWGWNRVAKATDYLTTKEVLVTLVQTISRNGNVNINVGPAADGTISPIMVERLLEMGKWLSVNGQGVYNTRPWDVCNQDRDGTVFYTRSSSSSSTFHGKKNSDDDILYAHITEWPSKNLLVLSCPEQTDSTTAYILGLDDINDDEAKKVQVKGSKRLSSSLLGTTSSGGLTLQLPQLTPDLIPCNHIWVIALKGIGNFGAMGTSSRTS